MTLKYETKKISEGHSYIIGCDEVGRGCLAGPVVAAAVCLRKEFFNYKSLILNLKEVKDSKLLTAGKREELSEIIKHHFLWSIAEVSSTEVDEINIHNASLLAMRKAVEGLLSAILQGQVKTNQSVLLQNHSGSRLVGRDDVKGVYLYIDGKFKIPNLNVEQEAIIGGDNKVLSIAAASIIAKVYRDELMQRLHNEYPVYNFAQHKGYATLFHRTMILENGLTQVHRKSFCKNISPSYS